MWTKPKNITNSGQKRTNPIKDMHDIKQKKTVWYCTKEIGVKEANIIVMSKQK